MTYNTGNAVPSTDPRDLDDNSQAFDRFLQSQAASEPDRLGQLRKTWSQLERDAAALVSPNVAAFAALTAAANKGVFFSTANPAAMGTYTLTSFVRSLGASADQAAFRTAIAAAPLDSPVFTGNPQVPTAAAGDNDTTAASTAFVAAAIAALVNGAPGALDQLNELAAALGNDANFAATVTNALALKAPLASPTLTGTPRSSTPAVGTNTTQIATAAMIQAELANKRAWTVYTPTITATAGAFTTVSATGKYLVVFGVCYLQVVITVTTVGTGTFPTFTLPFPALSGSVQMPLPARESAVNGKLGSAIITAGLNTATLRDYVNGELASANGATIYINGSYPIA